MNSMGKRALSIAVVSAATVGIAFAARSGIKGAGVKAGDDGRIFLSDVSIDDYITVGDYLNIAVEVKKQDVSDDAGKEYINTNYVDALKEAGDEDTVNIGDIVYVTFGGVAKDTGEEITGGSASEYPITIGSGEFIDGFEEAIIGLKKGEEKDFDITFPDPYVSDESLSGKEASFHLKVDSIYHVPVYNDEMAKEIAEELNLSGVSTTTDLENKVQDALKESTDLQFKSDVEEAAWNVLRSNSTAGQIPEEMLKAFRDRVNKEAEESARIYSEKYGTDYTSGDVIKAYMSVDGYTGYMDDYINLVATNSATNALIARKVASEQNLIVTDEEILKRAQYTSIGSMPKDVYERMKDTICIEKVKEWLYANVTVTAPAKEAESEDESGS